MGAPEPATTVPLVARATTDPRTLAVMEVATDSLEAMADMTMSLLPRQETTALTRLATSERPPATTDPQTPAVMVASSLETMAPNRTDTPPEQTPTPLLR